ncbi:MAG: phage tail protein [Saprospiraceae bacterium]
MFAGNFAPRGWAFCDGQLLAINSNQSLFSILGTTYGGDGRTTFGLPDLRGRAPIHAGLGPGLSDYRLGNKGGQERVTLTAAQMPSHSHSLQAHSGYGDTANPNGTVSAKTTSPAYKSTPPNATMNTAAVAQSGGGQAHENRQPYIAIHYIIALQGVYPSRN